MKKTKPQPNSSVLRGRALIDSLLRKFDCENPHQLQRHIGWTGVRIGNVQAANRRVTARQVASLVARTHEKSRSNSMFTALLEFRPVERFQRRLDGQFYIVDYVKHPQIRDILEANSGIYVFFNSEGNALYVGRALKRSLWDEVNSCYRSRRQMTIFRAVTSHVGKMAQIKKRPVYFHDTARYVSCYQVEKSQIANVEALLIRCMANLVFNVRMERFAK